MPTNINYNMSMLRTRLVLLLVSLSLAACGGEATAQPVGTLPTLAELPTVTATLTPLPLTATPSPTPTLTPTITPSLTVTVTASATITDTPTPTVTNTLPPTFTPQPTPDNEGLMALARLAAQATILPQPTLPVTTLSTPVVFSGTPATTCAFPPPGGFGTLFLNDPTLISTLGCPLGSPPVTASVASAYQPYERGAMLWLQGPPLVIYVFFNTGRFQRFDDTYNSAVDPFSGGETPPSGLFEPVRGFGKVWRQSTDVRNGLGWAAAEEIGGQGTIQSFDRGRMIYLPARGDILILVDDAGGLTGTWRGVPGSF